MINNPKTKKILKQVIKWVIYMAFVVLTLVIPNLYWLAEGYGFRGQHAVCSPTYDTNTHFTMTQIDKIITDNQPIDYAELSGEIQYDDSEKMYYISDGLLRLPLNLANCQNLEAFQKKLGPVSVRGAIKIDKTDPIMIVQGLHDTISMPLHVLYNGASGLSIIILLAVFIWLCRAVRWLLGKIGISSLEQKKYSEANLDNSHAGYLLLIGLFSVLFWLWNPYFGMTLQILAVLSWFKSGLRSNKKKIAIIGLILNGVTFLIMLVISIAQFSFTTPRFADLYVENQWANNNNPAISVPLDLNAYTNTANQFTFHAPNGWTKDESGKDNMLIQYIAPETFGTNAKGEPVQAKISAMVVALPEGITLDQFIDILNKETAKTKEFHSIGASTILLAGGQLTAQTMELTAEENDVVGHVLAYLVQSGNNIYMIAGGVPDAQWKDYEPLIRDSLRTFTLY